MTNKRNTLIAISGIAAGLLLVAQFVNWFQVSVSVFGSSMTAGYNAWNVNGSSGFGSGSDSWLGNLGSEGSTWQTTLMAFAGPLMLAATVLAGMAAFLVTQGKLRRASTMGTWAGISSAVAVLFGFLMNYTSDNSGQTFDLYFGAFVALAGTVTAFVAGVMCNQAAAGNVPGPTPPTTTATRPPTRP